MVSHLAPQFKPPAHQRVAISDLFVIVFFTRGCGGVNSSVAARIFIRNYRYTLRSSLNGSGDHLRHLVGINNRLRSTVSLQLTKLFHRHLHRNQVRRSYAFPVRVVLGLDLASRQIAPR